MPQQGQGSRHGSRPHFAAGLGLPPGTKRIEGLEGVDLSSVGDGGKCCGWRQMDEAVMQCRKPANGPGQSSGYFTRRRGQRNPSFGRSFGPQHCVALLEPEGAVVDAIGPEGIAVRRPGVGRGCPTPLHGRAQQERLVGVQGPTSHPPVHGLRPDVVPLDGAIRCVQGLHVGFVSRMDAVDTEPDPARTPFPVCNGRCPGSAVVGQQEFPTGGGAFEVFGLKTERTMHPLPPAFHESVQFL